VRVLLDENIPLALLKPLSSTHEVEHIILLGQRGMKDEAIRVRLLREELLFVTQDEEFLDWQSLPRGMVLLSRVAQSRPLNERIRVWHRAIDQLLHTAREARMWELVDSGELLPWKQL
jgi:hypothetical protein